ncbi:manganese efflux pump MntP family protein [Dongia mobilis]|jgi:putative Mn2+ efflux pump MntP|uniref:manganese efflux pump MntP n=1 Tax=Dongia sp. TaxID=1977262 RepID=UPI0026EF402B
MTITTSLALAFSLSADAFAASLGKGASLHRPGIREAARIGAYFGVFELATPLVGLALGWSVGSYIEAVDHWIAFTLLLVVGGRMSYLAWSGVDEDDRPKPSRHTALALIATALATSVDATAVGVTLGFMNLHIPTTIALIGAVTFAMAFGGVLIGRAAGPLLGRWAEFAGGIGLVAIGAKVLVEHGVFG